MTSAKNIKKLIENAAIETDPEATELVLKGLLEEFDKAERQDSAASRPSIRRMIMKSTIVKLAAAAVIIVVVAVGLMHWLPGGERVWDERASGDWSRVTAVKIPKELAQMSVEELLDMHFGKTETAFERSVVAAAVAKALEGLSAREILAIGQNYSEGSGFAACMIATLPPALSRIVEACDFVVHARVDQVDLDVSDLKAAIIHKQRNQLSIYSGAPVKTTVQLNVLGSHPSLPSNVAERIDFTPVLLSENINLLEEGKEYLIAFKNDQDIFWLHKWNRGIYPVEPNGAMAANLRNGPMTIDEVWAFVMDAYDAIHEGALPSGEILDYWLARLQSNDMTDCLTAIEYFNTLAQPIAPQDLVMDAMERFLSGRIIDSEETSNPTDAGLRHSCFALDTLDLLTRVADEPTVERMMALYEQHAASLQNISSVVPYWREETLASKMIRLALKHPGPERHERFLSLFSQLLEEAGSEGGRLNMLFEAISKELGKTEGADIDELFVDILEDPAAFGISEFYRLSLVWKAVANRDLPEFGAYLEQFLSDPPMRMSDTWHAEDAIRTYVRKTGDRKHVMLQYVVDLLEPQDTEFIPFLREALANDHGIATVIADVLADPCFIPVLRAELEKEVNGELLRALFACGQEQEAIGIALAGFENPISDDHPYLIDHNPEGVRSHLQRTIIQFLGTTGDQSVLPFIGQFTTHGPQRDAVLALGRLGSESAIPPLRELYESEDIDIIVRIATALSLYCLGDDTGYELLQHFANGTARSLPQIHPMGGHWIWHQIFEEPALYLRSPRTDELLLESFRSSYFCPCTFYAIAHKVGSSMRAFAREYEREVLPILVDQLSNRNPATRKYVNALLKHLTGQDFAFQPERFVGQQDEQIEKWRSYVERYLAQTVQPAQ
jgi:hypothetical protein